MKFSRLDPMGASSVNIHAEGRWTRPGETDPDPDPDPEGRATVCVAFGPQYGPVTAAQVEMLMRAASRRGYDELLIAGFAFDRGIIAGARKRKRQDARGLTADERQALQGEAEEARVWLDGFDRINNCGLAGPGKPGIALAIDLSATPFYIKGSNHPEGQPFPCLVSARAIRAYRRYTKADSGHMEP